MQVVAEKYSIPLADIKKNFYGEHNAKKKKYTVEDLKVGEGIRLVNIFSNCEGKECDWST